MVRVIFSRFVGSDTEAIKKSNKYNKNKSLQTIPFVEFKTQNVEQNTSVCLIIGHCNNS